MSEVQVVTIPIDKIEVEEGHNPRTDFDVKELEGLTKSIQARGLLTPIQVRENPDKPGFYLLVAGERRYRASQGVIDALPAVVSNGRTHEQDERLVDALVENVQRQDISTADEVSAYRRLKDDHGWDAKRIAYETGVAERRVTKLMKLLALPQDSIDAAAALPDRCRDQVVKLASVHAGAAGEVAKWLVTQAEETQRSFAKEPCALLRSFKVTSSFPILVEGGYYDAQHFQLDQDVHKLREELDKGFGVKILVDKGVLSVGEQLQSSAELADGTVIGGWDVVCAAAAKAITKTHADKQERQAETERINEQRADSGNASSSVVIDPETGEKADDSRAKELRSERYKADAAKKENAIAFNDALGPELLQRGASIQLTAGIARLLSDLILQDDGVDWTQRGLRYLHPNGKLDNEDGSKSRTTKYVEGAAAGRLLKAWVGSAKKADDIIGRTLVVVLASRLADKEAVAMSNRRGYRAEVSDVVFDQQVLEDELDKLVRKLLPKQLQDRIAERAASSPAADDDTPSDEEALDAIRAAEEMEEDESEYGETPSEHLGSDGEAEGEE